MSQQQTLFDSEPAPWELDDAAQQHVATVVFASRGGRRVRLFGPRGSAAGGGLPREGAAGARQSERGGLLRRGRVQDGRRAEAQGDCRGARPTGAALAVDAAGDAVDGGVLSLSLGPGARSGGAGRSAAKSGHARCDTAFGAAGGRFPCRRSETVHQTGGSDPPLGFKSTTALGAAARGAGRVHDRADQFVAKEGAADRERRAVVATCGPTMWRCHARRRTS